MSSRPSNKKEAELTIEQILVYMLHHSAEPGLCDEVVSKEVSKLSTPVNARLTYNSYAVSLARLGQILQRDKEDRHKLDLTLNRELVNQLDLKATMLIDSFVTGHVQ